MSTVWKEWAIAGVRRSWYGKVVTVESQDSLYRGAKYICIADTSDDPQGEMLTLSLEQAKAFALILTEAIALIEK